MSANNIQASCAANAAQLVIDAYRAAYQRFARLTPIAADCGALCRGRCCRGGAGDGMVLFPGERLLLEGQRFLTLSSASMGELTCDFAVCKGRCIRALRPLSCRIYPLMPVYRPGERVECAPDPRARRVCPLVAAQQGEQLIQEQFAREVEQCFAALLSLPDMERFLLQYTAVKREFARFLG